MGQWRHDVSTDDILKLYAQHQNYSTVCRMLNCSIRLVWNAINEGRPNPPESPAKKMKLRPDQICECCGFRAKHEDFRFLCLLCYQRRNCGDATWGYVDHS